MKKGILLTIFLISGFVWAQTTVNLEDQCNCEVLSGTLVTAPGTITPTGADVGDIYVNTNTGTIYFWDGDSWELTSTDSQQLQVFSFNPVSNQLTLTLENGGTFNADLSNLAGDGNITSATIDVSGDINALLGDVVLEIGDDAVTNAKLADNAVQTENILNGTILTEDISSGGNNQVLVTDAVGTVAWVDKSSFDAIADQVTITGVGTTADPFKVEDLSIVTAKLADGAVTTVKLGDDAVTNAKLADNAVQTENILSGGIDQVLVTDAFGTVAWVDKSSFDAISDQVTITGVGTTADPFKVEDLSIVTAKLADGAVTTVKLGDDAVTNTKLADNAVQTENILNGTILTEDISSGGSDQVLVTDAFGTVAWVDKSSFDAIADQVTITGVGTIADPFKVEDLSIVTAKLADGAVTTVKLGDDAVTNAKLADNAVQTENILNGTILTEDISSGGNDQVLVTDAVGTVAWVDKSSFDAIADQVTITGVGTIADPFKVEDLSIVTAKLADGAVTTVKLGDDAVTNAKLADNAVETENILNGTILTEDISSGGNDQVLVTDAVGTVAWVDKSSFDAISDQVTITGVGTTADPFKVEDLSIVTAKLGDDAVTNAKLADNAVQTENILNGTILTEDISSGGNDQVLVTDAVGTVAWVDKSSFDAIADQVTITGVGTIADPFKVEDLSIVTAKLADGAVTTIKLGDDAVTNAKLADDAVQTENILNGTILTEDISSGGNDQVLVTDAVGTVAWVDKSSFDAISDQVTITGVGTVADPFKVEDLSIITAKLGDDAVTNAKLADNAVQTENILNGTILTEDISSGGNDQVLVTDAVGTVAWVDKSSFDAIADQVTITGVGTTADPFKVEDLSIVTAKLADGAVTTVKLGDDAVTNAKLADDAVQTENILNGTILTEDISSGGNDQVLVTDAFGTVAWVEKSSFDAIADQVTITGVGTIADPFKVEDLSIVTAKLADGAVTTIKLGDDAVTNAKLADNAVETENILNGTILTEDISSGGNDQVLVTDAVGTVAWVDKSSFAAIADQVTITGVGTAGDPFKVEDLSIVTAKLGADAVTNAKLADNAVETENILNGTILTEDISSGGNDQVLVTDAVGTVAWVDKSSFDAISDQVTITGVGTVADPFKVEDLSIITAKLGDDAVTNAKLADNAVETENILNGTILTEDISSGGNDQVLVTDAVGTVVWVDKSSFAVLADQVTITGVGTTADPFKVDDLSIVNSKLGPDAVTNAKLADDAVQLENIADGTLSGQVMQWDGADWILIDLGSVTVTEVDGVIGNEILNATDATLVRSGAGTNADPYTLDVSTDGITNAELADNAVETENILSGGNDKVLVTDAVGTVAWVDKSSFAAIADQITITGVGTAGDPFKVEDLSIVTAKLGADAVTNAKLADNAVQTENILNGTILTEDISSGGNDQVLVTDAVGTVVWVDKSSFAVLADQVTITGVGTTADPFKVDDLSIVNSKLGPDAVTNAKLADDAVQLENIADGTLSGQVMQWDGADWILIDLGSVTVTEVDGVIGNEILNATDATLVRSGAGTNADPYTLDVSTDGITNAELADNAVETENILSGGNDKVLVTDAVGTVAWVDKSSFAAIADQITITGVGTAGDPFKVEDLSIVTAKLGADAVTNAKLADNAVQTENILNGTILTEDISSGGNDQVLVTDAVGTVAWVDKSSFAAIADQVTITGVGTAGDPFKVEDLSIVTAKLGADAVTNAKLADNAVQTENILNGTILTEDISSGGNDQVLVTDAVGTVAWVDKSSFAAIADQITITGVGTTADPFKVEDLSIVTAKLGADAVTNAKLADNAVQTENILSGGNDQVLVTDASGTVEWVDKSSFAAIADQVTITGVGTAGDPFKVEDLSIVTAKLGADAVTNAKLADNAVETENILNGTILTEDISSGGNDQVLVTDAVGTVAWIDKSSFTAIADQVTITGVGTIGDPFKVEDLSIVTAKLGADAVTNAKLADNAVQTENILSGGNDKVLVTDASGTVVWVDKSSFAVLADQVTITGVGTVGDPFKVDDLSIVNSKLGPDAVTNAKLADDAVQLENIADGTVSGQVMQWDGTDWILVDLGSVTVTEVDGVIGNEVTNATDGTLVRSGSGTTVSPYTLDVSADGITNAELADGAVRTENIFSGGNDQVLVTDAVGTVAWVDKSSFAAIADQVTITGVGTIGDPFKVEDLSIVTAKLDDDAVTNAKLADNAVETENILNGTILTEDISSGGNDQVLVTDASGTVEWVDKSSFAAIADQITITGVGTTADPFKVEDLSIVTAKLGADAVTNAKLADNAVQTENILSGGNDKVLVTDASGTVVWVDKSSFAVLADQVTITGVGTVGDPFKVDDLSIVNSKLGPDAVTNAKLADDAVQLENIADGTVSGQVMQWDGTDWILVDLGSVTVTEVDGVIGNEVTNATDGTLVRSGSGTTVSPYTLDVSADGITNAELADGAVRTENIFSGGNDQVLVTDASGTVEWVDKSSFAAIADQVTITGVGTAGDPFKVEDLSIVTAKLGADAVTNAKLADNAVETENILNGTILTEDISSGGNDQVLVTDAVGTVAWVDKSSFAAIADQVTITGVGTIGDPFKVEDLSIVTAKLDDDAVTNAKLADNAVETENILNGTILTEDISSGGNDQVLVTDASGTVEWVDKSSFAAIADQITITGVGTTADPFKVEDLSIVTAKLGADAVTNAKLADNAVQTENILNGTILTEDISSGGNDQVLVTDAVGTVVWVDKSSFAVLADQVTITGVGTVGDPFKVEDLSIVNSKLGPDAVTNAKLADDAVQLENIADGTVSGQVMQWDGTEWTLVDLGSVTVTENDGVIGNEVTNATDGTLVRSGSGTTVSPYTLDISADGITNAELADNAVGTENILSGGNDKVMVTDATGTVEWVDKSVLNSDNQTLGIAGDQLSITGGNTVTVPTADGSETIVTGAGINVVTGSGTTLDPYVITATEVDGSITNEVNTAFAVVGSDLSITDGNGTLTVPLASLGTDDQNIDVLTLNATSNILTVGIENGNDLTVDLSGLVADGSETIVTGAGINVVTGSGTTLDPYVITATEVDGSITNEVNTAFAVVGSDLSITDGNGTLTVPLASLGTDDQNIDVLTLNATSNILTVGIENGNDLTVDLSGLVADGSETVVTGGGINVVTGSGTTLDPYVITATEVDGSITNEVNTAFAVVGSDLSITDGNGTLTVPLASLGTDDQNIDVLTLNATSNILTVGIENGNDLTVDLSGLVADGSETIVTGAGINVVTGSGTTLDPYVITATEVDGSITNEVNTAFAVVGSDLSITDGNGTLTVPLASLGTDDQKIDKFALNGTTLELSAEDDGEADKTIDLNSTFATDSELSDAITASEALDLDKVIGNEVTNATDATLIRSGLGTTASPYTLDVASGGITTTEILDGTIAPGDIADKAVTLTKLADGTADGQVMQWDDLTSSWTLVDLGSVTVTENDGVIGNEVTNATDGTLVRSGSGTTVSPYTLDISADGITNAELADNAVGTENILSGGNDKVMVTDATGTVEWVDKSVLNSDNQTLGIAGDQLSITGGNTVTVPTADGSETIVTGAGINVVTGSGTTLDPYVITATEVDGSITNEVNTAFAVVGSDLSITDGNGTLTVPLASLGTDDQNIDVLTLNATSNILTVGIENGNDLTVDLSGLVADGSETIVTGAGINVVTGSGTTLDPYVITATEVDGSITNEVNTAFAVVGSDLSITDGNGTLTVPLASLGTDDQNIDVLTLNATSNILTVGIENGNDLTVDLSGLVADGSETIVTGAGINVVTGSGTTLDPYVITATEVDGSITNEVNTAFAVVGSDLSITDGNGTLTVPLASLGTDDQNIDVLTLNATSNILTVGIENGNDLTVDLSGLVADGSETVVIGGGINVVTGSGTTLDPYVITATEVDGSITNEVNTAFAVVGSDLSITDGNGTLTVPLASLGTDDQNIDVLTLNATSNILTVGIENGNDLTVDLSGLVADGSETVVTGGGINVVTGSGTTLDPYVITATEVDGSITNEVNTAFAVVGSDLSITDGNGTLTVPLASLGTDDQNIDVLTLNATSNILTVGIENGNDLTVDLSGLVADGSETVVTGGGINVVTGSGTTLDPYVITATEVDGSITNEVNTAFAVVGSDLSITDGNGTLTVPLASLGTDDQKIDKFALNGTTLELSAEDDGEADKTIDLNTVFATDAEVTAAVNASAALDLDKVIGNEVTNATDATLVRSGLGTTASPFTLDVATGGITTTEILDGTIANADLANNSVTGAKIVDGTVATADLANSSVTTAKIVDGTIIAADLANNSVTPLKIDASIAGSGISRNGVTGVLTVDIASLTGDGSITSTDLTVTGGTNSTLNDVTLTIANNAVTSAKILDGTIASADLANNSITTGKILNGTILAEDVASGGNSKVLVTSSAGIVEWIDKSTLVPTTTVSNISSVNTLTTTVNGVTGSGVNIINSNALSLSGTNQLTSTVNGVSSPALSLNSFLDNTDSQTLSTNATPGYIAITGGNNVTLNVNDADSNIGNEYNTDFAVSGGNLTITDGGAARSVALSSLGSDDQTLTLVGNDLTIESGNTITLPSSDGTETLVAAGNDISVTGDGSSASPYVVANTRPNIFYPPSIAVDASSTGTLRTINLFTQYTAQFGSPMVSSNMAPTAIPTYANTELYYYVTYYDNTVFANVSVDEFGVMTYDVIATPTDYNSLINVVFVVK